MEPQADGETQESEQQQPVEPEAQGEQQSAEAPEDKTETVEATDDAEDEVVISIGEEPPPPKREPAPAWVKELRKTNQELARKNRELEERIKATMPAPKQVVVGKKPTLEDAGYDAEKFEAELASWYERKRKADEVEAQARAEQENQQAEWNKRLKDYGKARAELRVSDFDDAESAFLDTFSQMQQVAILHAAENPHHIVYALGKNPSKAKELASIKDPAKFAYAAGKLEAQLKVQSKKPTAAPEKSISGTGRVSGAVDSTLERLRAEAEKTGNYSKVIAYKNKRKSG